MGAAAGARVSGLSHRRLAEDCADSDSEGARARGARCSSGLAPAGLRYQHATKSEIKNFDRPPGVLLRALDPRLARNGVGAVKVLPPTPSPNSGRWSHLPLGPASRCRRASGRVRRALSFRGKKERNRVDGRRALLAASADNRRLRRQVGRCAEEWGSGRWRRNQPNSRGLIRRGPGMQAGEKPAGDCALGVIGGGAGGGRRCTPKSLGINYCLGAWGPARAASEVQRPPSRPPTPPPKETAEGAAGAGK